VTRNNDIEQCFKCYTRRVQKVRRLTQLATRYANHILSLFNIVSCSWNALGPAFFQSSDSVIEELLFLVLQPAICRAIRIRMANTVGDGVAQSRHFGWQPVLELTCEQVPCPDSKWLLFLKLKEFIKGHKVSDDEDVIYKANGWLVDQEQQFYNGIKLWRNAGPSALQLQETMLKIDKIWCGHFVVNCVSLHVSLRTFWTRLV